MHEKPIPPPPPPPPAPNGGDRLRKRPRTKRSQSEREDEATKLATQKPVQQTKPEVAPKFAQLFSIQCLDAAKSPDPRSAFEVCVAQLAKQLRADPTIPADHVDASKPDSTALREDTAVELPLKHCAFRGCAWEGETSAHL
eukprot:5851396-Karenia_brevis.AAC.1